MVLRLRLQHGLTGAVFLTSGAILFFALVGAGLLRFAAAVVADPSVAVENAVLQATADYFPSSARLQTRLAARLLESNVDAAQSHEETASQAFYYANRAVSLNARSYEAWLLRALAKEMQGDLVGAESDLQQAVNLAPARIDARWRLANLLLRSGKLAAALPALRVVLAGDPTRQDAILNLVWEASDGDVASLRELLTGDDAQFKLKAALFLVRREKPEAIAAAIGIFRNLDKDFLLKTAESGTVLDALLAVGNWQAARQLWGVLLGAEQAENLIWNGDFETIPRAGLTQFDWHIEPTRYVRAEFVTGESRSGQQALRLSYQGIETTRLENEIRQTLLIKPGQRYRLECFVKADKLETPNTGLQLAVYAQFPTDKQSNVPLAATMPLTNGSFAWRAWQAEFVAPAGVSAVSLKLKQTPEFSYTEPTRGTVWLDDCRLQLR